MAEPYGRAVGITHAHMHAVVGHLRDNGGIDLVHDHLEVVGPAVLAAMAGAVPPVLHTLHWDLARHPAFYGAFDGGGRVWCNGVSASQVATAPDALRRQILGAVPLAVDLDAFAPAAKPRREDVLLLARITPVKGQATAAALCRRLRLPLVLAGPVAGVGDPAELEARLADPADPLRTYDDARYFVEEVAPLLDGDRRRWVGSVGGDARRRLLAGARAVLHAVRWEEPGATAAIEALACGTPVVALRRGALAEIVAHGVTGFLADDEDGLAGALRRVEEIDPVACRRAAEERFSAATMADRYLALYEDVLGRTGGGAASASSITSTA
jgi:glycosyltransferase involved in cell wall biosynthesis